jgi:ureidoglycolate dehydrogenase (NAD+)
VKRLSVPRLAGMTSEALRRRGISPDHVSYVVDGLLLASLRGIDTHGVRLFPTYLAELDGGRSLARPRLRWRGKKAASRLRLARDHGVGVVAVANSNHFGAASYYTLEMARRHMVALAFSNSDALVAPHRGRTPFFGTNPLSVAVRGEGDELFCADLATSQVSYSRVKHRQERGMRLEPGWALTPEGKDAAAADSPVSGPIAALEPLGGHKGQCLGMAVEILCSLLTGMPLDHQLSHLYSPPFDEPRRVSHLFIALEIAAFTGLRSFRSRLSQWLAAVRRQPALGGEPVLVPGDLEAASRRRRARGIPLSDDDWLALTAIERGLGR